MKAVFPRNRNRPSPDPPKLSSSTNGICQLRGSPRNDTAMLKVKVSTPFPQEPIIRQTPGRRGIWGNCRFYINEKIDQCDFWVVYEGLLNPEKAICPASNVIFLTGEPPEFRRYNGEFLKQFATVVTPSRYIKHHHMVHTQTGLPWHVGRTVVADLETYPFKMDYDRLKAANWFSKDRLISIISSSKTAMPGHAKRLGFAHALQARIGAELDFFGRDIRCIEDKWDAIAPYKYHIVIENSVYPDYWTEKLADAFLAGAYPIYFGCPNLEKYFSTESYATIDIEDIEGSTSRIREIINGGKYEVSQEAIARARQLILDKYNMFAVIAELCDSQAPNAAESEVFLRPEYKYSARLRTRSAIRPRSRYNKLRDCFARVG